MALKKICPMCKRIIDAGTTYCKECTEKREQNKADNNKYYDRHRRNRRSAEFYHSREWIKTRAFIMDKYNRLDLYAYFIQNSIVFADMVHHIVEVEEDWNKRLDVSNLFPLTNKNHNIISAMYFKDKKGTQTMLYDLLDRWNKEIRG